MANPSPHDPPQPPQGMPYFDEWFGAHSDNSANVQATLALAEVVQAVSSLRKKGKVTVTVEVAPIGGGGRQVATAIRVDSKLPQPDPEASIEYVGDSGTLHRQDPYQQVLHLADADIPMTVPRNLPYKD